MKAIHARPEPLGNILQGHQFAIPEYQRPYSWGVEQCDKLWDDISSFFDEKKPTESYFLGSIVVFPCEGDAQTWNVVDGQQRLTTLMILIQILFERAGVMKILQRYLYRVHSNTGEVLVGKPRLESRVHASAGRNDREDLHCVLDGHDGFTSPKSPFSVNYNHLKGKVDAWAKDKRPEDLEAFIRALGDRVVLLPLECSAEDDALDLFQIINDRGMHLGDADIFKAKIYSAIASKEDKDSFISRWGNLSDHDSLFRAFMHISRAAAGDTNKEIALRKYVNDNHLNKPQLKQDWESILRCLEVCSWVGGDGNMCRDAAMRADATIYWQILACYPNYYWQYPLYVFVHKHADGENGDFSLPHSAQEEYIALLEYTVRYFYIKGMVYNSVNAVKDTAYKVCAAIANGRDYAAVYQQNIDEHGDMTAFERKLTEDDYGRCRKGLILINSLPSGEQEQIAYAEVLLGKYHIEHILPRGWAHYDKWDEESYAQAIDTIGNLIPLEWQLNIKASNEFFQRKQKYYAKSEVPGTSELAEKTPPQWYPRDVKARQQESLARLLEFFAATR
ncbi:MAG: DUF262 domain-containing HNH endonuclease family protein [Gammaproteobacteria bacterium]